MNQPLAPEMQRALEDVIDGKAARGRYLQSDIDAALPTLALVSSSFVPVDELPPVLQRVLEDTLEAAGALAANDEEGFHLAVKNWLDANPIHPQLQLDLRAALDPRGKTGGQQPRTGVRRD